VFWAKTWADKNGGSPVVADLAKRAARMGDWLRYSLFDKYFKTMGCTNPRCQPGKDYDSAHYLLSWYYAWGGSISKSGAWAFRIGASSAHGGYQNPLAAYVLAALPDFKAASPNAARDWQQSLDRQLEFYQWLQAAEGGIAGGATNSWNGRYEQPPAGRRRSTAWPTTRRPCITIRPATSGSGSRRGRWTASRSTTTSPATRARRRCWTSGSAGSCTTRSWRPTGRTTSRRRSRGAASRPRAGRRRHTARVKAGTRACTSR
jgi:hypothetical protein